MTFLARLSGGEGALHLIAMRRLYHLCAGRQRSVQPLQTGFADFYPAGASWLLCAALERPAQPLAVQAGEVTLRLAFEEQGPEAVHGELPLGNRHQDTSLMMKSS